MIACDICGHQNDVGTFADFACGACGQPHTWTEGQTAVLSESQRRSLQRSRAAEGKLEADMASDDAVEHVERIGLNFLLTRIGSWTNARWDQHLRDRLGDDHTVTIIRWLAERGIRPHIPEGTSGRRLQEETPTQGDKIVRFTAHYNRYVPGRSDDIAVRMEAELAGEGARAIASLTAERDEARALLKEIVLDRDELWPTYSTLRDRIAARLKGGE